MCVRGVGESAPVSVSGLLHRGGGLGVLGTYMFNVVDGPVGCGWRETHGRLSHSRLLVRFRQGV